VGARTHQALPSPGNPRTIPKTEKESHYGPKAPA